MQSLSVEEYRATMTEAQFEAVVIELAGYLGYECFHVHDARRFWPGWPDWIAFRVGDDGLPGRIIWFELKREGEKLQANQVAWQTRIRAAGGECYAWWPHNWTELEAILKGPTS